jgi:hypothetical protein
MSDRILYYPHINVPQNEWLSRAVLYWDKVGCILPHAYDPYGRSTNLRRRQAVERYRFTRELIDAELVAPIEPDQALGVPDFIDDFLALLDSYPEVPLGADLDLRHTMTIRVHRGKLEHQLLRQLRELGLAEGSYRDVWIPVEQTTAELYVAYLAARLGALQEVPMTPATDERESLRVFQPLSPNDDLVVGVAPTSYDVRHALLSGILPAPGWSHAAQLHRFKESHGDELKRMRKRVEREIQTIVALPESEQHAALDDAAASLVEEADELRRRMEEHGWPAAIGSAALVLAAAVGPPAAALHAGDAVGALASLPAMILSLRRIPGSQSSANSAVEPLAYAVIAQRKFG